MQFVTVVRVLVNVCVAQEVVSFLLVHLAV